MTLKEFQHALNEAAVPIIEKIKTLVPCRRVTLVPGRLALQTDPEGHFYDVDVSFGRNYFGKPGFRYEISIASHMPFDPTQDTPARTYYRVAASLLDDGVAGKVRMLLKTYHEKAERLNEEFRATNK